MQSVEEDLGAVASLVENDRGFRHFLLSPQASREEKAGVIERLFADRTTALTMQILRLLLEKGREAEIPVVQREYTRMRREHQGVIAATVTSAEALDPGQRDAIVRKMESLLGKRVEPTFAIDPHLIGGVKVQYENFVLDGSLRGSLDTLRDRLRRDLLKQS